jgi:hypothetical protein
MPQNDFQIDKDKIIDKISRAIEKTNILKKSGISEINRGLDKIQMANGMLPGLHYLQCVFNRDYDPAVWKDTVITGSLPSINNQLSYVNNDLDEFLKITLSADEQSNAAQNYLAEKVSSTDFTAGTAFSLGVNIEYRIHAISPSYEPKYVTQDPEIIPSREKVLGDLLSNLQPYNDEFVIMVKGSESALQSDDPDTFSQSAHSMRECYEEVLRFLAPSDVVKAQPWFEPTEGALEKVSRRSRIRYMLYGSGKHFDESEMDRLDDEAGIAKDTLDICIKRAHLHDPSLTRNEIIGTIDLVRRSLLRILTLYKQYHNK